MGAPEKRKAPGGKTWASQQSVSNDENSERNTDQHTTTQAPVNVRIANIQRDGSAQMRAAGTDPATVTEYADAMRDGAVFPPITVYFDGETHWPADGFHRIEAAALIKAETILAEVRHGNRRDAILAAAGANAAHGLRRTAADRRRAIESLLRDPEWTGWSDREIGKTRCADHKTVGKIRRELTGEIPSDRTYAIARKIQFHSEGMDGVQITLDPLALTPQQVETYRLPRIPIKESEARGAKFQDRFGEGAVELDALEALHPGELARLVTEAVGRYLDPTLASRVRRAAWDEDQACDEICRAVYAEHADAVKDINDRLAGHHAEIAKVAAEAKAKTAETRAKLRQTIADADPLLDQIAQEIKERLPQGAQPGVPEAREASPVEEPLFDSTRDYLTQADHYRRWQGRDQ